jgi:hypothetical protein
LLFRGGCIQQQQQTSKSGFLVGTATEAAFFDFCYIWHEGTYSREFGANLGANMLKDQFIIAPVAGAWLISSAYGHRGPFSTRADAVREAVTAADAVKRKGRAAEVLVARGSYSYSVWSSEWDSYFSA